MRRLFHFLFHTLSGLSAILFLVASLITYRSYNIDPVFEFSHGGMKWELAADDGVLSLDNQPQLRLEQAEFDARTAYLQPGLHQAWGTTEWRERLNFFQKLEREQAAVATPTVAHTVRLLSVLMILAVLPVIFSILWVQAHPTGRRRIAQLGLATSGVLALLLFISAGILWERSRRTMDQVSKPTRWHFYEATFGTTGLRLQSFHLMLRSQQVMMTYRFDQSIHQSVTTITPISAYTDVPIRYADSLFARQRESAADVKAERWGAWKWRSADRRPTFSFSMLGWMKDPRPLWPTAGAVEMVFGQRLLGGYNTPFHTEEKSALVGHSIWLPYWFLMALAGPWTLFVFIALYKARRARKRQSKVLCQQCGYDIRATPERCPECGLIVASGVVSAESSI